MNLYGGIQYHHQMISSFIKMEFISCQFYLNEIPLCKKEDNNDR